MCLMNCFDFVCSAFFKDYENLTDEEEKGREKDEREKKTEREEGGRKGGRFSPRLIWLNALYLNGWIYLTFNFCYFHKF